MVVNVPPDDKNILYPVYAQHIGKFIIYLHIVPIIHETKGERNHIYTHKRARQTKKTAVDMALLFTFELRVLCAAGVFLPLLLAYYRQLYALLLLWLMCFLWRLAGWFDSVWFIRF